MTTLSLTLRALAVMVFGAFLAHATPAAAQLSFSPTKESVKEDQLLNALKPGGAQELQGRITIPDGKASTLIRPAGREWRDFHQGTMRTVGAIAVLGMLALLIVFYMIRGKIRIPGGPSNAKITRFSGLERFAHWTAASCFMILALSGLNVTFGKAVLMPIVGPEAFATLSAAAKWAHNYLAWPFIASLILMFLLWVKDNIPSSVDLVWFAKGGGIVGEGHPPARRFNGGQKIVFWSVILGGAALSVSGIYMLFPYTAGGVLNLQFWNSVHGIVSVLLVAMMMAHIYIGSVGMEGAFDAMGSGDVDLNWAKEHHSLWVQEEMSRGSAQLQPAE